MRIYLLLLVAIVAVPGCKAAEMELPSELNHDTVTYDVQGRLGFNIFDETFSFGPYAVTKVDRGWTETTTIGIFSVSNTEAEQKLTIAVKTPSGRWLARCAAGIQRFGWDQTWNHGRDELNMDLAGKESFACELIPPSKAAPWAMSMTGRGADQAMHGNIIQSDVRIDISGSHDLAGSSIDLSDPAGYLFRRMGKTIGAVDVINQGIVVLPRGRDANFADALAVVSATLLLRQDLIH